ncbi:oxidoreductase [Aestuariivirga sp.]|uniref:oxidoreductase n=1 Tax=Aestuariivirga sp. TaxID=2650926 RepID=UPI003BAD11C9
MTIEGLIDGCNAGLEVRFDLTMLEALPARDVKTQNPWETGIVTYRGVLISDVLKYVHADGKNIQVTALNDYRSVISVADIDAYDIILSYQREGLYMPVREKGPLFIVFPFTDVPALANEFRYAQSVWQVSRITVK